MCWAREVLVRYGDREDVRRNLVANLSSESWSGPTSVHYQAKRDMLAEFREQERDKNVLRWLDEFIADIDLQIVNARISEERKGRF
jgi:hypothetical protein